MTSYTEYEQDLITNVNEYGWQFSYVFDPNGEQPDFGYSVGMATTLKSPEFIIFGLPKDLMHDMIWEVFYKIKAGKKIVDGTRLDGLLEGYECICCKAQHPKLYSEYATSADWHWQLLSNTGNPVVYQIVWPGAQQGLFPWEDGCLHDVIIAQPQLWL